MEPVYPHFNDFQALYNAGKSVALWTNVLADLETPVSAYIKLAEHEPYSFLLESVEGGAVLGRYSFLGLKPDLIWKCYKDQKNELNRQALTADDHFERCPKKPLETIRQLLNESHIELPSHLPPSCVGIFGFMGYDMIRLTENIPDQNPDTLGIPDSTLIRPTMMLVFDNVKHLITLVAPIWHNEKITAKEAYHSGRLLINNIIEQMRQPKPEQSAILRMPQNSFSDETQWRSNTSENEYSNMVSQAKDYMLSGDIFQVVLSQRFEMDYPLPPFTLYRSLRRLNPSPFLFYLNFDGYSLVGSSPEILVRVRDNTVTIRPIAGTRKRGKTPDEDRILAEDMMKDPKECAEHLMLLDLGRNDVGKVSEIGSVRVTDKFFVEYYSHVMHMVSNVEGTLKPGLDGLDALFSGFPAGTVSGAPKIRAMEIIDELEKHRRSFYAGCVGYLGADGNVDSCITLRTGLIKDGKLYVQAGGGVVKDSTAKGEYQESQNKARALMTAAQEALLLFSSQDT